MSILHPLLDGKTAAEGALSLPKVQATITKTSTALTKKLGGAIDESCVAVLTFPPIATNDTKPGADGDTVAILQTSLTVLNHASRAVLIQGTLGTIEIVSRPLVAILCTDPSVFSPSLLIDQHHMFLKLGRTVNLS